VTASATIVELFRTVLGEVVPLMAAAYRDAGAIGDDHVLAQAGLADGEAVVIDYLEHGEAGVALEHLLYMVQEPPLALSSSGRDKLDELARRLGCRPIGAYAPVRRGPNP